MKIIKSFFVKFLCLVLVASMLLLVSCESIVNLKQDAKVTQSSVLGETVEDTLNIKVEEKDDIVSYALNEKDEAIKLSHNTKTGEIYYTDADGTYPLQITEVSEDGIAKWKVKKENEILEGEVNTSEAPTPQFALAIAGSTYVVSSLLYCLLKATLVVTIAGTACYVASAVGTTIKNRATNANYFPAYQLFGNVYVATNIGISQTTAVVRIKTGQHVWAKNATYAKRACVLASPIRTAKWDWHGNRNTNSGYYQHYHAVKYFKKNGQYVHTGAHCWFM